MMDKNSREYVVIRGEKYFVQDNKLDLTGTTNFKISEIEGLGKLKNLEELYLKGNGIKKIENLEGLTNLKFLNLCENNLTEISGLENLTNLEWLLFGCESSESNKITKIKGNSYILIPTY